MRTLFLSLLLGLMALPAQGQDFLNQWRSFVDGTWVAEKENAEFVLEIETTPRTDTLRLSLRDSHAPKSWDRETIECLLQWRKAGELTITKCPQTTLARTAPPSETTLHFSPDSKAHLGLVKLAKKFTGEATRAGNSLVVGTDERFRLVKQKQRIISSRSPTSSSK